MLLVTSLVLCLLALFNYRISGRALFHPAVVFCWVWAINLFLIWMVGDFFYPISTPTLLVLLGGACGFSVGSAIASFLPSGDRSKRDPQISGRLIGLVLLVLACGTPLAVRWMSYQVGEHPSSNFFVSASLTMLDESLQGTLGYSLFANLVTFATLATVITFRGSERYRKRWLCILLLALVLNVLTAGRSGIVTMILSLLCLDWIENRRIRWKLFLAFATALLVIASLMALYLGKGETDKQASVVDNAAPIAHGLVLYAAGGIVAFDRVVRDPAIQPREFQISRFFVETLNKFGAGIEMPNTSSGFLDIGPNGLVMNVNTIYYTYFDLGYVGMMAVMIFLGAGITACYRRALLGGRISAIMYGAFFAGLVLSPFGEFFFHSLNFLLKLFVLACVPYFLPRMWSAWRKSVADTAQGDLAAHRQL